MQPLTNAWVGTIIAGVGISYDLISVCCMCRRISMAGLSSKTVPHLADAIHAAVTRAVWSIIPLLLNFSWFSGSAIRRDGNRKIYFWHFYLPKPELQSMCCNIKSLWFDLLLEFRTQIYIFYVWTLNSSLV